MSQRAYARVAYVTLFVAIGAMAPYLPVYFRSLGLELDAVGLLAALSAGAGILGAPLWGVIADRFAASRLVLPMAAGVAAVAATLLALAGDPLLVVPIVSLLALAMAGIPPILDARALEAVAEDRHRYGRLRVWGSGSFILSVLAVGWLIERTGIRGLFIVLVCALVATALVGLGVRSRALVPSLPRLSGIESVVRSPVLPSFLLAALVAWSSSAAINGFLSIYLLEIGAPESLVGIAWALGAIVELPLMIGFPWLVARVGLERLLLAGAGLFALRALAILVVHEPVLVTLTMLIHGGGFALVLVGGVTYVSRHAPRGAAATAQGMLSAVTFGLSMILGPGIGGMLARQLGLEGMFLVAALGSLAAMVSLAWALGVPAALSAGPRTGEGSSR
jgi:MFS transporter, PPP family, 3-phenylpropionic acid transporter